MEKEVIEISEPEIVEEIKLPDGWEWKKLGEIAKTTSGGTPSRGNRAFWENGNIPWLKSGELTDGFVFKSEEFITEEALKNSSAKLFTKDTLLLALYGATAGKLGILDFDATTNQAICAIKNEYKLFDNFFLFYYLLSKRKQIIKDSFGGAQPNISQDYVKNLLIPLPTLPEQKRIVAKLDILFEKIDKSIKLLEENIEYTNKLMASVLNDVFEELETNHDLSEIKSIIEKNQTYNPEKEPDSYFTYIDISSIDRNTFKINPDKYLLGKDAPSRARKKVQTGDVLFATTRPNLKNIGVISENYDNPICSTGLAVLRVNKSKSINKFVFYFLISEKLQDLITPFIRGAQYPAISDNDLYNCNIPLPSLSEQQRIVTYLDQIFEKSQKSIKDQKQKLENIKALKSSILNSAFKGEL
ncbi:MAG: restriction endonuclease subunit S [Candidatus Sericytochromatia bacterium]